MVIRRKTFVVASCILILPIDTAIDLQENICSSVKNHKSFALYGIYILYSCMFVKVKQLEYIIIHFILVIENFEITDRLNSCSVKVHSTNKHCSYSYIQIFKVLNITNSTFHDFISVMNA